MNHLVNFSSLNRAFEWVSCVHILNKGEKQHVWVKDVPNVATVWRFGTVISRHAGWDVTIFLPLHSTNIYKIPERERERESESESESERERERERERAREREEQRLMMTSFHSQKKLLLRCVKVMTFTVTFTAFSGHSYPELITKSSPQCSGITQRSRSLSYPSTLHTVTFLWTVWVILLIKMTEHYWATYIPFGLFERLKGRISLYVVPLFSVKSGPSLPPGGLRSFFFSGFFNTAVD